MQDEGDAVYSTALPATVIVGTGGAQNTLVHTFGDETVQDNQGSSTQA